LKVVRLLAARRFWIKKVSYILAGGSFTIDFEKRKAIIDPEIYAAFP